MANTRAKPELRSVTIAVVRNRSAGQQIQAKLKSAGIESFLTAERSVAIYRASDKGIGAVKVQVGRSAVQHALKVLGAANLTASANSGAEVKVRTARNPITRLVEELDPRVQTILVIAVIIAALVLFLS